MVTIIICDKCRRRKETFGVGIDGWENYDGKIKCLNCRLEEAETELREFRMLFDRMLSSDLIRKETCKSFHKDLEKLKPKFASLGAGE